MKQKIKWLGFSVFTMLPMSIMSILADDETPAATEDGGGGGGGGLGSYLPLILYFVVIVALFYFLLIRPGRKRQKKETDLRGSIILGDNITTIGGITGRVINIKDDDITIESGLDRTQLQIKKWAVKEVQKPISE
jgi:preprotein translocase subunit YajC